MQVKELLINCSTGDEVPVGCLLGDVMVRVNRDGHTIDFESENGCTFSLGHQYGDAEIEDIVGELDFLVGSPLTMAHVSSKYHSDGDYNRYAWHFYQFATVRGYVTVRFLGSDGYYAAEAPLTWMEDPRDVNAPAPPPERYGKT